MLPLLTRQGNYKTPHLWHWTNGGRGGSGRELKPEAKRSTYCSHMGNRRIIQLFAFFGFMAALTAYGADNQPAEVIGDEESVSVESKWGSYAGEPVTKWNPDGRRMTMLTELRYTDPQGFVWVAPI